MNEKTGSIVYVLPDKLGGVFNYVENLLVNQRIDIENVAILINARRDCDARSDGNLSANAVLRVDHDMPAENLYAALRRVARAIQPGAGVIVANDWIELATETAYPSGRMVVNVTHGDYPYYYDLALRHESAIDCFVTCTEHMHARLLELLPKREQSIFKISHGVRIPAQSRTVSVGPIRLLYCGRLARQKGVFDLPAIDGALSEAGIPVNWTIQGTGPDEMELRAAWLTRGNVVWKGQQSMESVLKLYKDYDVMVMPSRAEGLPLVLLEAGAAGVVPVVSALPGGIPEVVENGITGFRLPVGDVRQFANAIAILHGDRQRLEAMSGAVRQRIRERFDIVQRAAEYDALYARWPDLRQKERRGRRVLYGSRLDQPWIPNALVKAIRGTRQRIARMGLPVGGVLR